MTEPPRPPNGDPQAAVPAVAGPGPEVAVSDSAGKAIQRDARGYWLKGNPPGPGRPRGSYPARIIQGRRMLVNATPEIVKKVIDMAKAGDLGAIKLVLDRVLPTMIDQHRIDTNQGMTGADLGAFVGGLFTAMRAANLSPDQITLVRASVMRYFPEEDTEPDGDEVIDLEREAEG